MARVAFHTLGCKLNYAETGALQRTFASRDFDVVRFGSAADVTVINTCSVTEEAERKCRQAVRKALRANSEAFVIVTGCYAQLRPDELAEIPGVDLVLGSNEKHDVFRYVSEFTKAERTQIEVSCIDEVTTFGPAYAAGSRTRAFLKVQDGCDYSCSFCTIPRARGRSRSQSIAATVRQAKEIARNGTQEIVLSGVNIGLFGQDTGETLPDLIDALDRVSGIERYRISSIEPNLLTDQVLDRVAQSRAFQPHFHIPLQSGNDEVLGAMRRRYRRDLYAARIERIRSVLPDACIGVDVIVGFPAETSERFKDTAQFLTDLPVSYLHVFTYSERPDTVAVDHPERIDGTPVPIPDRSARNRKLRLLSESKLRAFYRAHLGTSRPVLWERRQKDGRMSGYTDNYIRVTRSFETDRVGAIETVMLEALGDDGLVLVGDGAFMPLV